MISSEGNLARAGKNPDLPPQSFFVLKLLKKSNLPLKKAGYNYYLKNPFSRKVQSQDGEFLLCIR